MTSETVRNYGEYGGLPAGPEHLPRLSVPYRQFQVPALRLPDKVALVAPDGAEFTFAETDELIRKLASGMRNMGVRQGEAVTARIGNHWMQLPWFLALMRIGAIFHSTSKYLTEAEVAYQLNQTRPRLIIGDGGVSFEDVLAAASDDPVVPLADEWAPSHIRFSSGTTGKPKMMLAVQKASAAGPAIIQDAMQFDESDRHLVVGPLSHAALHYALPTLNAGGTVIMREAFDKESFFRDCGENGITNSMVVPTMIATALGYEGEAPALRKLVSLGASLAPALKERLLARFPQVGLYEMYGSSECGNVTWLMPEDQLRKPASVGKPRGGQEVLVADDDGNPVPVNEIGTVYARGPMLVSAYVGEVAPPAMPERLKAEGWLTAGDVGFIDEEGDLTIADRRVDLILSGGLNVYPAEVEAAITRTDGIREVAVIGIPDERWGHVVTAYYVGEADEEAILATCQEWLAKYKHPRRMFRVDTLFYTSSGKISRKLVRDAVAEGKLPS